MLPLKGEPIFEQEEIFSSFSLPLPIQPVLLSASDPLCAVSKEKKDLDHE